MISSTTIVKHMSENVMREASDPDSGLVVTAFSCGRAEEALRFARLECPGNYVLVGQGQAYAGESSNVANRLRTHLTDPLKAFATECFTVCRPGAAPLEKNDARYLEGLITESIREAGLLQIAARQEPRVPQLPDWRKALLDRSMAIVIRLFRDAGCTAWVGAPSSPLAASAEAEDEAGTMEVGVSTAPIGTREFALEYAGMWARGYEASGRFIVCAGSEIRVKENSSIIAKIRTRRERLLEDDLSSEIPGVSDRRRLNLAIAFDTMPVAAKTVSGAHLGTDSWVPLSGAASAFVVG